MPDGYPNNWDQIRRWVYRRDNYQCQNCGRAGGKAGNAELHAHHRVPKSKGGSHHPNNLVTVCKRCHEKIHGHPIPTGASRKSRRKSSSSKSTGPPGFTPESMDDGTEQLRDIYMSVSDESSRPESISRGSTNSNSSSRGGASSDKRTPSASKKYFDWDLIRGTFAISLFVYLFVGSVLMSNGVYILDPLLYFCLGLWVMLYLTVILK